jgi:2-C-methyl-D-erythritol 4-phosphate cytidylyltransferase
VGGGATRSASVRVGLAEVAPEATHVLVHDAARPLLPAGLVPRLLHALGEGVAGAVPALPVTDTIKRVRDGLVSETLARDELVAVQTPQAFAADALRAVAGGEGSDCASLVEAAGGRVAVVPGSERLLKVTSAEDLRRVESWLASEARGEPVPE